jgi:hypothetical protein
VQGGGWEGRGREEYDIFSVCILCVCVCIHTCIYIYTYTYRCIHSSQHTSYSYYVCVFMRIHKSYVYIPSAASAGQRRRSRTMLVTSCSLSTVRRTKDKTNMDGWKEGRQALTVGQACDLPSLPSFTPSHSCRSCLHTPPSSSSLPLSSSFPEASGRRLPLVIRYFRRGFG